jgi:hypothetical protein
LMRRSLTSPRGIEFPQRYADRAACRLLAGSGPTRRRSAARRTTWSRARPGISARASLNFPRTNMTSGISSTSPTRRAWRHTPSGSRPAAAG